MKNALSNVQGALFDVPLEDVVETRPTVLVFEPQADGTLRAEIPSDASKLMESSKADVLKPAAQETESACFKDGEAMPHVEAADDQQLVTTTAQTSDRPGFTEMWLTYRATVLDGSARIEGAKQRMYGVLEIGKGLGSSMNAHYMLRETQSEIVSSIYSLAEKTFAPVGTSLKIERKAIDLGEEEAFDPDSLWLLLEKEYGGDAGVELGYKQLAAILVDKFCLKRREPVRKQNRLLIEQGASVEKRFSGGWEYTYSTVEYLRQGHRALEDFCKWAEDTETSMKIGAGVRAMKNFEKFESRARMDYGSIHTISFKDSMQYELYGDLAEKFHEFIAVYGAEALADKH